MKAIYAIASGIVSPLGASVSTIWEAIAGGHRGITQHSNPNLSANPFFASVLDETQIRFDEDSVLSSFEQLSLKSIQAAIGDQAVDPKKTVLILATTKGNTEWLQNPEKQDRIDLHSSTRILADHIGLMTKPLVVSHACVSGVTALQYGARLLQSGRYQQAIIAGADMLTRFVLSGFQSFQAIADEPCRPFDAARKGINLGEAAATIILSTEPGESPLARLCGGATSNDANHISGPSRSGHELARAITNALFEAGIRPQDVDAISAHGTATIYNDEMEAKAFAHAGVIHAPLHSLKGYLGHTLGAAGVLESALLIESLRRQMLIPSIGFQNSGVSEAVNVTREMQPASIRYALKTASGFGGCNAAVLWERM